MGVAVQGYRKTTSIAPDVFRANRRCNVQKWVHGPCTIQPAYMSQTNQPVIWRLNDIQFLSSDNHMYFVQIRLLQSNSYYRNQD
jgi:hypothetical protein